MPIYEYSCRNCGTIELFQKVTDEKITKCPKCDTEIERVISITSRPKFNGSGFYETDYVNKKGAK